MAAHFPEPAVDYRTPSFMPRRQDFTSHREMMAFVRELAAVNPRIELRTAGVSQGGRAIPALVFGDASSGPTVLIIGLQHGNEPAGGEAALVIADRLARGDLAPLLERLRIVIVPRANPDGAEAFRRVTDNGLDVNRDHTLQRSPEGRALGRLFVAFAPDVVIDAHEFTVGGRWERNFGGLARPDILVQYAMTGNLPASVTAAQDRLYREAIVPALERAGLANDWYFTSDPAQPLFVSMGGILADTSRNVAGLRGAVSFLFETRGAGIGRTNWNRRVFAHVVAMEAVLRAAARRPVAAPPIGSDTIILAEQTVELRTLVFLDPASGAEKPTEVQWRSSLTIRPTLVRARAAGYLLAPDAESVADRLAHLGVRVERLPATTRLVVETYRTLALSRGAKQDVRGDDKGAGTIVKGSFATDRAEVEVPAGTFYVPTTQPLGALAAIVLEPESPVGYVANGIVPVGSDDSVPIWRALSALR
jgi:hypothetical protein